MVKIVVLFASIYT